jgi:hypothetical protein
MPFIDLLWQLHRQGQIGFSAQKKRMKKAKEPA